MKKAPVSLEAFLLRIRKALRRRLAPSQWDRCEARRISEHSRWINDGGDAVLRFEYSLGPSPLILDLGGYKGQWASDIFARHLGRVYVFEPITRYASEICGRFKHNPNIKIIQCGLGASTRKENFAICEDASSLFRPSSVTEECTIVDSLAWFEENMIEKVDLMKVNIEGGEYELLERMIDTGLLAKVLNLQIQFHNLDDNSMSRMQAIQNALTKTHHPTYQYPFIWENWRRRDTQN